MRIGIFGGSFNPVHEGHMRLADYAVEELNLDRLFFVPNYKNPLKQNHNFASSSKRITALKKILKRNPRFSLSLCEIEREGPSYTIDTLKFFEKKYGKKNIFYFIAGADTLKTLSQWKSIDDLKKRCRFVIATRPGYSIHPLPDGVLHMPFEALAISSTQIRKREIKKSIRKQK